MKQLMVAIVGGDTLLAREVRELLSEQAPEVDVKLISDQTETAILTERGGEPVVISGLEVDALLAARVVILAGSVASSRQSLDLVQRAAAPPVLIDLSYGLEGACETHLRAPLAEPLGHREQVPPVLVIAHPAAIVLAMFLRRLHAEFGVRRSVAHVFAPASERGRDGIEELQQQTIRLLSFKSLPREVFDAQLSFNLLPRYGGEARVSLQQIEARLRNHLAELLSRSGGIPVPSVRLVQAPVFHGYSISVWAEMERAAEAPALIRALASEQIEVRSAGEEPPTNVGVAGQAGLTVGCVETDRNSPGAAWFWITADNHRITAENAVCLTRLLIPSEGSA